MTECEIQILITNNNIHEKHKQKPDQTQNMTPTVGRVLLVSNFFNFTIIEATVLLGTLNA